jgi:hypothetical protein
MDSVGTQKKVEITGEMYVYGRVDRMQERVKWGPL